jgi:hypothetical protein
MGKLRIALALYAVGVAPRGVWCKRMRVRRIRSPRDGIKQNHLYRVLPGLADDGLVVKEGRGWKPNDAA